MVTSTRFFRGNYLVVPTPRKLQHVLGPRRQRVLVAKDASTPSHDVLEGRHSFNMVFVGRIFGVWSKIAVRALGPDARGRRHGRKLRLHFSIAQLGQGHGRECGFVGCRGAVLDGVARGCCFERY